MSEIEDNRKAPNAEDASHDFNCDFCKKPINQAEDCVEVPLCTAYPARFMHHVGSGNPARFHIGCWNSSQVRMRVEADRQQHRRECPVCGAEPENEFMSEKPEALKGENATGEATKLSEDAEGLGPMHVGRFVVGAVDRIVGEGGVEVPGFVPTKDELLQLVRYWATEIIDLDFDFFLYGCTGSSEWRTRAFANRRLSTIAELIGEEEVTKAFRQAEQAFGKRVNQRAWKIFMEGTKEEQEQFQKEVQEEMARDPEESRDRRKT